MKPGAREAMRQMPLDGKRKLLATHRPTSSPLRQSKTGPDHEGESSISTTLKRFSLASVGWGAGSLEALAQQTARPSSIVEPGSSPTGSAASPPPTPSLPPISAHPQQSASWSSWWSAASNATGIAQVSEGAKDTPQFYVDQLRSV